VLIPVCSCLLGMVTQLVFGKPGALNGISGVVHKGYNLRLDIASSQVDST